MRTPAPPFDPNYPPKLGVASLSAIYDNPEIAEEAEEYDCLLAVDVWGRLKSSGGSPLVIPGEPSSIYLGIVTGAGERIMNEEPKAYVNTHVPVLVKAKIREQRVWKRLGIVERVSTNRTQEHKYTVETQIQTLESFETEVVASVSASTSVQGLVTEASMTASLSTALTQSVSEMRSVTTTDEITFTEDFVAGNAYVDWAMYRRYHVTWGDEMLSDWLPFSREQFLAIKPAPMTYSVLLSKIQDNAVIG